MHICRSRVHSLIGSLQILVPPRIRLAFLLRYYIHPMQLGHHHLIEFSPRPSSTQSTRKRSSAADAIPHPQPFRQQSNTDPYPVYPVKVPRSASVKTPREAMRAFGASPKKQSGAHGSRHGTRSGKNKRARQPGASSFHSSALALPRGDDPIHDAEYINRVHQKVPLKEAWEQNPKSPLMNFLRQLGPNPPKFCYDEITIHGNHGWRQVYRRPFSRSLH